MIVFIVVYLAIGLLLGIAGTIYELIDNSVDWILLTDGAKVLKVIFMILASALLWPIFYAIIISNRD